MLRQKLLPALSMILLAGLSLLPLPAMTPTASAQEVGGGFFQVFCSVDHSKADDPIVFPGVPGASHMHSFYGNTTTNANSTTASLMAAPSSCGREMGGTDHSAYWVPALMQNGQIVNQDQTVFVYYERAGGATGPKVQAVPTGLRMIAGDAHATSPQSGAITYWSCGGGGGGPHYSSIPTCNQGLQGLHAMVQFPSCWNGHDLDSTDHKSHMAYADAHGNCPASHPVSIPMIHYDLDWPKVNGGSSYSISSGPLTMHGDFFNGWDVRAMNAMVDACVNANVECESIERHGDKLTVPSSTPPYNPRLTIDLTKYPSTQTYTNLKDTPLPTAVPTHTATPVPTHTPSPSPSGTVLGSSTTPTTLPETGPIGMAAGAAGIAGLGYAFYRYRRSRLALKRALKR
jgi:hypothetical protein